MRDIPVYSTYGLPLQAVEAGYIHAERVMARGGLHAGRVRPHIHPNIYQLTYWFKGEGYYQLDERELAFKAPALAILPKAVVHGFVVDPDTSDAITFSFSPVLAQELTGLCGLDLGAAALVIGDDSAEWQLLGQIFSHLLTRLEGATEAVHREVLPLVRLELATALRLSCPPERRAHEAATEAAHGGEQAFHKIRHLIEREFRGSWDLPDYIAATGRTAYQLNRLCRSHAGQTLMGVVALRRLLEAQRLLLFTDMGLEAIALDLGFTDSTYFSRFFRKHAGQSPGRWRQDHRAKSLLAPRRG